MLTPAFALFAVLSTALPHVLSHLLTSSYKPSVQQYQLIKSFSMLLLGMFLSSLATLNFSLAFLVGLLASPLTFAQPWPQSTAMRMASTVLLNVIAPGAVLLVDCAVWKLSITGVLREAAFGWDVSGMYTAVVIWCVWWPAWLVGSITVLGRPEPAKAKTA